MSVVDLNEPVVRGLGDARNKSVGWHDSAILDIVCGNDRSTSVTLQRLHASRASRSVELPTGHHPFISHPDLVVEQLQALVPHA